MKIQHVLFLFLLFAFLSVSCRKSNEVKEETISDAKTIVNPHQNNPNMVNPSQIDPHQGMPSSHANMNPVGDANIPVALEGKIVEVTQVEKFTYLKLATSSGEVWSAVPKAEVSVGQNVNIVSASWVENFESKTLNKKFEKILFGQLELKK